jgi:hypothetical protein
MFSAVGLNEASSCGLVGQVGCNPQVSLDQMRARRVLPKVTFDRRRQARGGKHPHHRGSGNLRLANCLWQELQGTATGQGNCADVATKYAGPNVARPSLYEKRSTAFAQAHEVVEFWDGEATVAAHRELLVLATG